MNLLQQLKSCKQRGKQGFSDSKEDTIKKIKINIKNNDFSITYRSGRHRQFYKIIAHLSNIHMVCGNIQKKKLKNLNVITEKFAL